MHRIIFTLIAFILSGEALFAQNPIGIQVLPNNSLIKTSTAEGWGLIEVLTTVQGFLLKVALPLLLIGSSLYIAYELFLAEGNEEKLKKAWKSLAYSSVAVIAIALSYAIVSLVSRLSL